MRRNSDYAKVSGSIDRTFREARTFGRAIFCLLQPLYSLPAWSWLQLLAWLQQHPSAEMGLRCFAALWICGNLFCHCNAAPFMPLLFFRFQCHHPKHEPVSCWSFMEHTGKRNEVAFVQVTQSCRVWNIQLSAEMCSWSVQGLILKCVSVGIHLLNVVWHEKLLVIAFGLAWWGWFSLRHLCFVFPAAKGVNSSLLGWLRLLRVFCSFHWFWLKTKNI